MPPAFASNLALPAIDKLDLTSHYDLTIEPFIPQIWELPQRLLGVTSLDALREVYLTTNPAIVAFDFSLVLAVVVFIISEYHKNYSWIDRLWSLLPTFYNVHYWLFAYLTGIRSWRLDIVAMFSLSWSARLTYNYWRKGGYERGSEDYRWKIIKEKYCPSELLWSFFNLTFISFCQSILLCLVTTPTYILVLTSRIWPGKGHGDGAFPQLLGLLLLIEFYADNQQWSFHQAKKEYLRTAKAPIDFSAQELDLGFNTVGLWQYSRHPNFAAEQAIWVALYEWSCFQSNSMLNWTFVGAALYLAVFQGSTPITEWISAGKYPEYKEYQARVGRFLPKVAGPSWSEYMEEQKKKSTKEIKPAKADKAKGKKNK